MPRIRQNTDKPCDFIDCLILTCTAPGKLTTEGFLNEINRCYVKEMMM